MKRVTFLIGDLHYRFQAQQLCVLAGHLPTANFRIVVLGGSAPWADELRQSGIHVDLLGWSRPFDARPLLDLRRLIRSNRPEVIHVWDNCALRSLAISGGRRTARLVVSGALPREGVPGWLDRHLIRSADRVLSLGEFDLARYRDLGVKADRLIAAAPAMENNRSPSGSVGLKLASQNRLILCIGPITWLKGYRDAIWALDILNHLRDVHHLAFVGPAPDRDQIASFARAIEAADRVHFLGTLADLTPCLEQADIVWVPSWRGGGVGAALEAMAAGRPVVASRLPELAEIVIDGETGFLVPPHDKVALARQSLKILQDAGLASLFGVAGKRRAQDVFSPQRLVQACTALYY